MGNPYCEKHEWSANHPNGPCPDCAELAALSSKLETVQRELEKLKSLDERHLYGHWSSAGLALKAALKERDVALLQVGELEREVGILRWMSASGRGWDEAVRDWESSDEKFRQEYKGTEKRKCAKCGTWDVDKDLRPVLCENCGVPFGDHRP